MTIPPGTLSVAHGGTAQDMVARESATVDLTVKKSSDLMVTAACASFCRNKPDSGNSFSVRSGHPNRQLVKVLRVIARQLPSEVVRQLAVWSITDNPSCDEVARHVSPTLDPENYWASALVLRNAGVLPPSRRIRGL